MSLDKGRIEISIDGKSYHINGLEDALDDVIGPMVNRRVIVRALLGASQRHSFEDVELDE